MQFLKLYVTALLIFFIIDMLWLGLIARNLYAQQIGFIMTSDVRWGVAILFYSLFVIGLVFFAILPASKEGSWMYALFYGASFGFFCYATYDLTNLATLKNWPVAITVYDIIWGTFLSGTTALLTYLVTKKFL